MCADACLLAAISFSEFSAIYAAISPRFWRRFSDAPETSIGRELQRRDFNRDNSGITIRPKRRAPE